MSAPAHAAKENAPPSNRPPGNVPPGDAPPCIEAGLRTPGRTASGPCACTPPKHGAVAQVAVERQGKSPASHVMPLRAVVDKVGIDHQLAVRYVPRHPNSHSTARRPWE